MDEKLETEFESLVECRKRLRGLCESHFSSLYAFKAELNFKRATGEPDPKPSDIRHITSTSTCYSSLLDCASQLPQDESQTLANDAKCYAEAAIRLDDERWTSDGSAKIYCRCRALSFIIRNVPEWNIAIEKHIKTIFEQMKLDTSRFAIGETNLEPDKGDWYPPNAYHTYWTLRILNDLKNSRYQSEYQKLESDLKLSIRMDQLKNWSRMTLAYQTALHAAKSSVLDSDQLAWALATVIRFCGGYEANLAQQDFLKKAFECLFETQTDVGSWRHYAPLFHYKKSGNAYCYVFETFAVLLEAALEANASFVRSVLKVHFDKLINLIQYAQSTQIPLPPLKKVLTWSSGHRLNQTVPESWATASVFSFFQCLRRLAGIWTRKLALDSLPKRTIYSSALSAEKDLLERTRTWSSGASLSDELWTLFVNRISAESPSGALEPDDRPIAQDCARSAIFHGPPGSSKTKIVRALAGVIGWDYVELHASHFVADGLPNVQRTADVIFKKLMELDHTVIFFDEIDELVREREGAGSDAFGRFLTTSMLPKLAELWESRKVMYFVATNHIDYFDRAITRSQRFDAVIFVSLPSFEEKIERLKDLLKREFQRTINFVVIQDDINSEMPKFRRSEDTEKLAKKELDNKNLLAKFVLLRWDELSELAVHLNQELTHGVEVNAKILRAALARIQDTSWRTLREYFEYNKGRGFERRDWGKRHFWILDNTGNISSIRDVRQRERDGQIIYFYETQISDPTQIKIPGYTVEPLAKGRLRLTRSIAKA